MRYGIVASALLALPSAVLAGQVPVINGIIGDVPKGATKTAKVKEAFVKASSASSAISSKPTAGSLRVVENSGVCGELCLRPDRASVSARC